MAVRLLTVQDLVELRLSKSPQRDSAATSGHVFPYVCPLTQRPMNGRHAFVYLRRCGCVFSETGLRNVCASDGSESQPCPSCSAPFQYQELAVAAADVSSDVIWLNPPKDVQHMRRERLAARRGATKRKKAHDGQEASQRQRGTESAELLDRVRTACVADSSPGLNDGAPGAEAARQVRDAQATAAQNVRGAQMEHRAKGERV